MVKDIQGRGVGAELEGGTSGPGRVPLEEAGGEKGSPGATPGTAAPSPHTPWVIAQGPSPGSLGARPGVRGYRRGQGQVPGWRGRLQRRSARARPGLARPPGSSRRRRRLNNPQSMQRKYRAGVGGARGVGDPTGSWSTPSPPPLVPPTSRAPSPSAHTWANNGGKGGQGRGGGAPPYEEGRSSPYQRGPPLQSLLASRVQPGPP